MSKNSIKSGWKGSLAAVLKEHNATKGETGYKTVASAATQDKRADVLYRSFNELRELGYKLERVEQFKGRHMQALVNHWEERGLSASTLQNNISILRTFAQWIGKDGLVLPSAHYVSVTGAASRTSIAHEDKSWQAKGIDIAAKIDEVRRIDARVALQMELQHSFGLRVREAMQLRPYVADRGAYLAVTLGTKGGRDRVVPIDTPQKRELIERAKTFAAHKHASTSDPRLSLAQVKNHYNSVCRAAKITRAHGITSHGLRHGYAQQRYKQETGQSAPVVERAAIERINRASDYAARLVVAEELGHSREDVTTHYLGR